MENLNEEQINYSSCTYYPIDVTLRLSTRMNIWLKGFFGRGDMYRTFKADNGIISVKNAVLPKQYLIRHTVFKKLKTVRNAVRTGRFQVYKEVCKHRDDVEKNVQLELDTCEQNLTNLKESLEECEKELEKSQKVSDSLGVIASQAKRMQIKTNIANRNQYAEVKRSQIDKLQKIKQENEKNWKKQFNLIDEMIEQNANNFCANISKKIRDKFDFNSFQYNIPETDGDWRIK